MKKILILLGLVLTFGLSAQFQYLDVIGSITAGGDTVSTQSDLDAKVDKDSLLTVEQSDSLITDLIGETKWPEPSPERARNASFDLNIIGRTLYGSLTSSSSGDALSMDDGQITWIACEIDKPDTLNEIRLPIITAGIYTGLTDQIKAFRLSDGTLTQIDSTAIGTDFFTTNGWVTIPFVADAVVDVEVIWIAIIHDGNPTSTAFTLPRTRMSTAISKTGTVYWSYYQTGETSIPSTFDFTGGAQMTSIVYVELTGR